MADRFEDLRVFIQVVDAQSISGAAEDLDVAPSAVSRRLKDLEERLGTQLIQRTTRQMSLTDSGRQFYDRARRILADLDEAEQLATADNCAIRGTLRLSVPLTFGNTVMAPIINDFMAQHPDLTIDLALDDRRVDLVEEGFDAVVRIGELDDSSLIARKLMEVRLLVCGSPKFLKKHPNIETPADLLEIPALIYSNSKNSVGLWTAYSENPPFSFRPPARMKCTDGTALMMAAEAGLGLTREPEFIFLDALKKGSLVEVLPDCDWGSFPVHILYPQNRHMPVRLRAFIDHLVAAMKQK